MSVERHREAMNLAGEADLIRREGCVELALEFYRQAGIREASVYDGIPKERVRTRGIIAVSVVSCFWCAGDRKATEEYAQRYLESDLPEWAKKRMHEMLNSDSPYTSEPPPRAESRNQRSMGERAAK